MESESKKLAKDIQDKIVELVQSGELLKAKALCVSSLKKFPQEMNLYIELSSIFELMGNMGLAQKVLEKNPEFLEDLSFLNKTMRFYLRNQDYCKAQAILEKVNQIDYKKSAFKKTVKQINIFFNSSTKQHEANIQPIKNYIKDYPNDAFGYLHYIQSIDCFLKFSIPEKIEKIWDSVQFQIKINNLSVQVTKKLLRTQSKYYSLLAINDSQLLDPKISKTSKRKLLVERLQFLLKLEKDQNQIEHVISALFSDHLSQYEINILLAESFRYEPLEFGLVQYIENNPRWLEYSSISKQFKIIKHCLSLRSEPLSSSIEKLPFPVDVVYTWCDINDPMFVEKFETQNGFDPTKSHDESTGRCRYINSQEINLAIVSLFKYFNAVNKIYIVTNDQQFELSFLSIEQRQKVQFISHKEIVPREYITGDIFNSFLIETFLWNIPGLKEYFIYFNDDMFLGNYLKPHHLFDRKNNAFALINPRKHNTNFDLESFIDFHKGSNIPWTIGYVNAVKQFFNENETTVPVFNMHQGIFLIRSECEKAFFKYLDLWRHGFFKEMLRGYKSVYSPLIYLWESIIAGKQKIGKYHEYNRSSVVFNVGLNQENVKYIRAVKPLFYCVNHIGDQNSQKRLHSLIESVPDIQDIPHVYELANFLSSKAGLENIIYIGAKTEKIFDSISKKINVIEINSESDLIAYLNRKSEFKAENDKNKLLSYSPKINDSILEKSLVLCSNIIERLSDPILLVDILARWSNISKYILISTPEGDRETNLEEKSQFKKWTLKEFYKFLSDRNFPIGLYGHTISSKFRNLKSTSLVISGRDAVPVQQPLVPVTAIINCYNESDIIEEVVLYLIKQNINIVVVDNWSTDGSYEIVKQLSNMHSKVKVNRFPDAPSSYFNWNEQLINTVKISEQLGHGWYIHYDADEIRESPWQNVNLQDAISFVDSLGYNSIDFTLLNFRHIKNDQEYLDLPPTKRLRYCEFGDRPGHFRQIKAWKYYGQKVNLNKSGGHQVEFAEQKVYPYKFLTRHYPLRSPEQSFKKLYHDRLPRFDVEQKKFGWHQHYNNLSHEWIRGWDRHHLFPWCPTTFKTEYLIERISCIGIPKSEFPKSKKVFAKTVCILGMHRSGTSCLAGSLQSAGLHGGKVIKYANDNLQGNRENQSAMKINEKILVHNGGSWDSPPKNSCFTSKHHREADRLIDEFDNQSPLWMFKDPRTILTLPFWQENIPNLQLIGTFRHPFKVAMSLYQRQNLSIPLREGLKLWIHYNRLILEAYRKYPFPLICFDLTRKEYLIKLTEIIEHINSKIPNYCRLSISKAEEFYNSRLVHQENIEICHSTREDAELLAQADAIYQELRVKAGLKAHSDNVTSQALVIPLDNDRDAYLKAIKAQPNNSQLYFMLANLERDEGNFDAAISYYKTSLKLKSDNLSVMEQLCKLLSQVDKRSEALSLATAQIESQPEDPRIYMILANLQREQKRFEEEIATYEKLVKLVPQNYNFYIQLGNKLIYLDRSAESIDRLKEALELFPQEPDLYFVLGRAYSKQQEYMEAIAAYNQAIELNHHNPANIYIHLGLAFVQLGQTDQALSSYQKAIQVQPDCTNAYFHLGNYYRIEKEWNNSITSYMKASELNCQNPGVYFGLGQALRESNRVEEAIVAYHNSISLKPEHFHSYIGLGHCYQKQQELAKAISSYQKSLDINPENPGCWFALGQTLRQQGKKEEAVTCYQKALEVNHPNSFGVYKTMGDTFVEIKDTKQAIAAFEKAAEIKPNHPTIKKSLHNLNSKK